jgi:hypothetical protein
MNKDILYAFGAVVALILLHASIGHAQEIRLEPDKQHKPADCFPLMYTLDGLLEQELHVLWQSKNQNGGHGNNIVLFTHDVTSEWVMLEMNEEWACVLGSGNDFYLLGNRYGKGESS